MAHVLPFASCFCQNTSFHDISMNISWTGGQVGIAYYEHAGRGLQAEGRIKNGELLLKIPKAVLLTPGKPHTAEDLITVQAAFLCVLL